MKFVALLFAVLCAASLVCAEEEVGEKMTNEEIQELINDYKDLNKNDGTNAPIREMAQKTKDLTMKYFKTVGVEIAKHMCNQLDNILKAFNDKDEAAKNEV